MKKLGRTNKRLVTKELLEMGFSQVEINDFNNNLD